MRVSNISGDEVSVFLDVLGEEGEVMELFYALKGLGLTPSWVAEPSRVGGAGMDIEGTLEVAK